MKILLVAATRAEIEPTLAWLGEFGKAYDQNAKQSLRPTERLECLSIVTGVGLTATAFRLGQHLALYPPDWVINIGIAGAIDRRLGLGEVVQVKSEIFADVGVEEADGSFRNLFDLGLVDAQQPPFSGGKMYNPDLASIPLKAANALTVNKVHGFEPSIEALRRQYPEAQVESMEGAAFFYACLLAGVPFLALRGISNYVEKRNRADWQIGLAIQHVNATLQIVLTDWVEAQLR